MEPDATALVQLADDVCALVTERGKAVCPGTTVEANVTVTRSRHGLTRFANSFIHQHVGDDSRTVSLTVAVDGRTSQLSATELAPSELRERIDAALISAREQPRDPHWPGATPPTDAPGLGRFDAATAQGDPHARAEGVRAFVDAGPELAAAGFLDTDATWVAFASTAGHRAFDVATRATIDGIHQTDRSAGSAHQTSPRLADLEPRAAGAVAAERARYGADYEDVEPGAFEVVLGPEAVATMLLFLGVYGFNAKMHLEGASFAQLDEPQFDEAVTILDDPAHPQAVGLGIDAEGSPRQRTLLVEGGVTRALAYDRRTAARGGAATTGAAIPGGETMGPIPTSLRMPGGSTPRDELIAGVERGLLITEFNYVRAVEPKTQLATGLTRNGTFLIEGGEVTGAVGNLRFTESFLSALAPGRVLGVGDDDRAADSEFGPGMVIAPSLRLAGFTFTGGARG